MKFHSHFYTTLLLAHLCSVLCSEYLSGCSQGLEFAHNWMKI